MLTHGTFLQQSHWIKSVGSYAFIYNTIFICVYTEKRWGFLFVLAERMNFPKAPLEAVRLPFCSMGKSTLDCLWDPNRKLSISHLAELLSQAACQYCFRKCSSSAFQAVLQIHTDSCQEAFLSISESEAYWDRRGRQLVLVISDNLHITRYSLLGVERLTTTETGQQLLWRHIGACFAVTMHIYLCSCHLLSSHRESRIFVKWHTSASTETLTVKVALPPP